MGSRIVAAIIVLSTLALLGWVAFGPSTAETTETATTATLTADDAAVTPADAESPSATQQDSPAADQADATSTQSEPDAASDSAATDSASPDPATPGSASPDPATPEPENYGPRMDLVNLDGWLNTDATSIDDFNGQVVLVEMWTFGCHNCKARIPFNQSYYEEFADENFEIIGVHAPEFSYEAEVANIENALVDLGVTWPVALDTDKLNFRAWQPGTTNFWPRTYVIDQNGDIRYDHIGEGKYEEVRETVRYLIENPPEPRVTP